ncbi:MAG: EamA family transporter [Leptolyngbyaceae cyanobacterium SM1_4_3]|nr:EamA family transporter [Leptolyngbyaceae cyanobacterium SM1_4_3]
MNSIIIALSYAFCWGVGITLTKIALTEISPTTLLTIQVLASVIFSQLRLTGAIADPFPGTVLDRDCRSV